MAAGSQWKQALSAGRFDSDFARLYGNRAGLQRARYIEAIDCFESRFGSSDELLFVSAPGRTEIGGNHTDHNHGKVLAGSVNLDVLAVVCPVDEQVVRIQSRGHAENVVELADLRPRQQETGHSNALIRGVLDGLRGSGGRIGGFVAYTTNDVATGSGLSSSAAFEVLVGAILNVLYNGGAIGGETLAQVGRRAENVHFGKPSGLLDQMGCVCGGLVAIDFADELCPQVEKLAFDFPKTGHALCITMAGGSHADLNEYYAAIPAEMKAVAAELGCETLRGSQVGALMADMPALRAKCGDRAVMRALHFYHENERVDRQVSALKRGDFPAFLALVSASGRSSFMYNQNITTFTDIRSQEVALALACSEHLLNGRGATRVHGGGFAGSIQAFVPHDLTDSYRTGMESVFGSGSCYLLSIRPEGPVHFALSQ